jgi:hypothetical protein
MAACASVMVSYSTRAYPYQNTFSTDATDRHQRQTVTRLDKSGPAIEVEVQVFYFTVIGELVGDVLLGGLLVHACDEHDPSLDRCNGAPRGQTRCLDNGGNSQRAARVSMSLTWDVSTRSYVGSLAATPSFPPLGNEYQQKKDGAERT